VESSLQYKKGDRSADLSFSQMSNDWARCSYSGIFYSFTVCVWCCGSNLPQSRKLL